jgi:hypothetical protein
MDRYYRLSVYRWNNGHRSDKVFLIDCRYYQSKIKKPFTNEQLYQWKWDRKYQTIVSIDTLGIDPSIHRWLSPSMHIHNACPRCISMVCASACLCCVPMPYLHAAYPFVFPYCVFLLRVLASRSRGISMLHVYAACPCCMPMLHAHVACPCCMPMLHAHATCPLCVSTWRVQAACICFLPMLFVDAASSCRISVLDVHVACPCCMPCYISMLHVHDTCPWCVCPCFLTKLYVHVHVHVECPFPCCMYMSIMQLHAAMSMLQCPCWCP